MMAWDMKAMMVWDMKVMLVWDWIVMLVWDWMVCPCLPWTLFEVNLCHIFKTFINEQAQNKPMG
jgi:hypothetical protein